MTEIYPLESPRPISRRPYAAYAAIALSGSLIAGCYVGEQKASAPGHTSTTRPVDHTSTPSTPQPTVGIDYQQPTIFITTDQGRSILEYEVEEKGRAPRTGYSRDRFGSGWSSLRGCTTRNRVLRRDLTNLVINTDTCEVLSGTLTDPYADPNDKDVPHVFVFTAGPQTSEEVEIDHVVSLSDAWQTGAQYWQITKEGNPRTKFANDLLNLLATSNENNEEKSDKNAASWLPPNKAYRCSFVIRQILVKNKYDLWVTPPEKDAMETQLDKCPNQTHVIRNHTPVAATP